MNTKSTIFLLTILSNIFLYASNDCAFDVLGLERTSAIQKIIDNLSNPTILRMVAVDHANHMALTTLTQDPVVLRNYLQEYFLHGDGMPGYYPGENSDRNGGILVALAHVYGVHLRIFIENRVVLAHFPELTLRTTHIDHIAADDNHPEQLNHFVQRHRPLTDLPVEIFQMIFDFCPAYPSAMNLIRAIPAFAYFARLRGVLANNRKLRSVRVPRMFVTLPLEHFSNPPVVRRAVGSKQTCCRSSRGPFSDWVQARWYTLLMHAIDRRSTQEVFELLRIPYGSLQQVVSWGNGFATPMRLAVSRYSEPIIRLLVQAGANTLGVLEHAISRFSIGHHMRILQLFDLDQRMALIAEAIRQGNVHYLRAQHRVLQYFPNSDHSPLFLAIANGQVEVISLLLEQNHTLSEQGWDLPTMATYHGQIQAFEFLFDRERERQLQNSGRHSGHRYETLRHGITTQTNPEGYTVVTAAAAGNQVRMLEYLRDAGFNPFAADREGRTGESIAREQGFTEVLSWYASIRDESKQEM